MIDLLRKSYVALLVLLLALVAQIPHAAYVFNAAPFLSLPVQPQSNLSAWLLAYCYAVALESATLMFVVHGKRDASYGFAGASFAVNLSYYAMHGVTLFSIAALPVWLLSALLPIAIASYSHILAGATDEPWRVQTVLARLRKGKPAVQAAPVEDASAVQPAPTAPVDGVQVDKRGRALQLFAEGLTAAQVAQELGAPVNTVKAWKSRYSNGAKEPG